MIICPECACKLEKIDAQCPVCQWENKDVDGIPILLSNNDRQDDFFAQYIHNYDQVAEDDLDSDILDPVYVRHQVENMASFVGSQAGMKVCDVGSGRGHLARALRDSGAESVTTVDVALPYLRNLKNEPGIRPIMANGENLPFADEFDVITTTDVMEHVLNIGSLLFSLNRSLRLGGRLFARVPYNENLLPYSPHQGCNYRFVHLRSFNEAILRAYLEGAGFAIQGFHYDGFILGRPQPFWMQNKRRQLIYNRFQQECYKRLDNPADVTRWPSRWASLFMPPCEIGVAAKKTAEIHSKTLTN